MKKFYPIILVVALAALAVGIIYWQNQGQIALPLDQLVSSTQNQVTPPTLDTAPVSTADWKIDRNSKYGYEIKYPEYWVKNSYPEGDTRSALEYKNASILLANFGHGLPFDWERKDSTIVVGGQQGQMQTYTLSGRIVTKIIAVPTNTKNSDGNTITINLELTGTIDESKISDFNQILSTFKFLN